MKCKHIIKIETIDTNQCSVFEINIKASFQQFPLDNILNTLINNK